MSKALHGILVSSHGRRFERDHCYNCNGLDDASYTGVFDPVAGFPPAGLSLVVLRFWLVILDARSVSSLLSRAREDISLDRHSTAVTKVVEGCVYMRKRFLAMFSREKGPSTLLSALHYLLRLSSLSSNTTNIRNSSDRVAVRASGLRLYEEISLLSMSLVLLTFSSSEVGEKQLDIIPTVAMASEERGFSPVSYNDYLE